MNVFYLYENVFYKKATDWSLMDLMDHSELFGGCTIWRRDAALSNLLLYVISTVGFTIEAKLDGYVHYHLNL